MSAVADEDPVHARPFEHDRVRIRVAFESSEDSDQREVSPIGNRAHGARQCSWAPELDDVIDAPAVGELEHFPVPLRSALVVHPGVRAKSFAPGELFIARRRHDHARTGCSGQLQRKHRYTARAQHENGISRLHSAHGADCVPRCDARACQGGTLLEAQRLGDRYRVVLIEHPVFREHAVRGRAQRHEPPRRGALGPGLEEGPGHAIAGLEPCYPAA